MNIAICLLEDIIRSLGTEKQCNQRETAAILTSIQSVIGTDEVVSMDIIELISNFARIVFTVSSDSYVEGNSSLNCIVDDEYECNYIIQIHNKEFQWVFSPLLSSFDGIANTVSFGVQLLTNKTEISLVIDSVCNDIEPSYNSVRYDADGDIRNKSSKDKSPSYIPTIKGGPSTAFHINDIISVKVNLKEKSVHFFKNGSNVYDGLIKFGYPWYFGLWPSNGKIENGKVKIVLNKDQYTINTTRMKNQ
eukprot:230690_1